MSTIAPNALKALDGFRAIAESVSRTARMVQQATGGMQAAIRSVQALARIPEIQRLRIEAFAGLMPRLADRGWYIGMGMTVSGMSELCKLAKDEDYVTIDQLLCSWYF